MAWLIVKVAAYQAPLLPSGSMESLNLIRDQIARCEAEGVQILCCPEAVLGGLADYSDSPECFAISLDGGQLHKVLSPLASDTVTTIVGFTEVADAGRLFNAAAVFHKGAVLGVYRKLHPAMRQSVYVAGTEASVFRIGHLTFGIAICLDSTFPDLARNMAASGATALFVPTNNGLPRERECADIPMLAKNTDISRAIENRVYVIRADVAGCNDELLSFGSSRIVDPNGVVLQSARALQMDLLVSQIRTSRRDRARTIESGITIC